MYISISLYMFGFQANVNDSFCHSITLWLDLHHPQRTPLSWLKYTYYQSVYCADQ